MPFRYVLDKSSKKFICPQCGKKRFVKYIDTHTKKYLNDGVGKCDRLNNCAFHYPPKQYFQDNNIERNTKRDWKAPTPLTQLSKANDFNVIPQETLLNTMMPYDFEKNQFIKYLYALFSTNLTNKLIEQFFLGTYQKWGVYATVFWQIDKNGKIRTGKIMAYDSKTGKRIKQTDKALISWYHSELKYQKVFTDYDLNQCLFGEHQIKFEPKDKIIAIVESEKTAILMTALNPEFIWVACGSLTGIKRDTLLPFAQRQIILFPDLNGLKMWQEKAEQLQENSFDISVSDYLEKNATEKEKNQGLDLADFMIVRDKNFGWALTEKSYPFFWDC